MDYPDGVYLIRSLENSFLVICVVCGERRTSGRALYRPLDDIVASNPPYMPMPKPKEKYQITRICSEDFIVGMATVNPSMTAEELLFQLGIDYTIRG